MDAYSVSIVNRVIYLQEATLVVYHSDFMDDRGMGDYVHYLNLQNRNLQKQLTIEEVVQTQMVIHFRDSSQAPCGYDDVSA